MKKIVVLSIVSAFLMIAVFGGIAFGADAKAPAKDVAAPAAAPVVEAAAPVSPEDAQRLALEAKVRGVLTSQEWRIYMYDRDTRKSIDTDSLTFTSETVNSNNLAALDYPISNYGLFVNPDGTASWETMKTSPVNNKAKAFLRGDLKGTVMTGTIFIRGDKANPVTYVFSTINPGTLAPLPEAVNKPKQPTVIKTMSDMSEKPAKAVKGKKK